MGNSGPSKEQIEAQKNNAVYAAKLQAEAIAREEAQIREQRAHEEKRKEMERLEVEYQKQRQLDEARREEARNREERAREDKIKAMERLQAEYQKQRELDEARQDRLNAQRTAELEKREAERQKKELELEKKLEQQRQDFIKEREDARQQAKEDAEKRDRAHKEQMDALKEMLASTQMTNNTLLTTLTSLMEQFQQSKLEFAEYFQQKPKQDIETPESLRAAINKAREELGLDTENFFNFAFVGHTKVGKSSLINAIRGMTDEDDGAAKVGITETTHDITSYSFNDPKFKYVRIYDIPGAGTLTHDANSYYEEKCLCAFDCLIIVAQNTLGQEEVEFASKSLKFNQPIAFVRSRCDIDLDNKKKLRQIKTIDQDAIKNYISELSQHYVSEIARASNDELKKVPCFFISAFSLYDLVSGNKEIEAIYQEPQFLDYIVSKSKFARNIVD